MGTRCCELSAPRTVLGDPFRKLQRCHDMGIRQWEWNKLQLVQDESRRWISIHCSCYGVLGFLGLVRIVRGELNLLMNLSVTIGTLCVAHVVLKAKPSWAALKEFGPSLVPIISCLLHSKDFSLSFGLVVDETRCLWWCSTWVLILVMQATPFAERRGRVWSRCSWQVVTEEYNYFKQHR